MPVAEKAQKVHSVEVQVNGNGFVYATPEMPDASTIHVSPGDHVQWYCHHGNYSVLFKGASPFADVGIHGRKSEGTRLSVVVGKPGSYKYGVTIALADGGLIVDDPEIIIDGD